MKTLHLASKLRLLAFVSFMMFSQSCYHYEISTHAQSVTKTVAGKQTAHSFFWGLWQKPQFIHTPDCDTLGSNGVAKVIVKTNLGYSLITVITLGIYCPMQIEWYCGDPCTQTEIIGK
jgi:hypothetical protein